MELFDLHEKLDPHMWHLALGSCKSEIAGGEIQETQSSTCKSHDSKASSFGLNHHISSSSAPIGLDLSNLSAVFREIKENTYNLDTKCSRQNS